MFEKIDVNGAGRHPLYTELTKTADAEGHDGDIRWNFEKFLVAPDGKIVARYSPVTKPDDRTVVNDIEANLPS
jgi:glutathione peroxidase